MLFDLDPQWVAPVLWRSKFRNILAGCMRRGTLTLAQACELQAEAESLFSGGEHEVPSQQVLQLSHDSGCSAYPASSSRWQSNWARNW